jgi:hypothetical protein
MSDVLETVTSVGITLTGVPLRIASVGAVMALSTAIYAGGTVSATLTNAGIVENPGGLAVYFKPAGDGSPANPGMITNQAGGLISSYDGISARNASLVNAGTIVNTGTHGTDLTRLADLTNTGTGVILSGGALAVYGALFNAGSLTASSANIASYLSNASGGVISAGNGVFLQAGTVVNHGLISGYLAVELGGTVVNEGTITNPDTASNTAIQFAGGQNLLVIGSGSVIGGDVAGFIAGDTIDFAGISLTGRLYANQTLTLANGNGVVETLGIHAGLALPDALNTAQFVLTPDGHGGTDVTLRETQTITGTYSAGLALSADTTSFAKGALVEGNAPLAVYGSAARYWTVVNAGALEGVLLGGGGAVANQYGGQIAGGVNLAAFGPGPESGKVVNDKGGVITGQIRAGTIHNAGVLDGHAFFGRYGVYLPAVYLSGGTLINAGIIENTASGGVAVSLNAGQYLPSAGPNVIVIEPGSTILGAIGGFAAGDTIDLAGVTITSETFANGLLTLASAGGRETMLTLEGAFETGDFALGTDNAGGTDITLNPPCFVAGTRILTPRGEVAVELLAVGEAVITLTGDDMKIKWIGRRTLDLTRHPRPENSQPVCFEVECFGVNGPRRALCLSPDHAIYIQGKLIPAKALVNGVNIRQLNQRMVTYYHIELDRHAIIFAEGTPVETYLETGNRGAFENAEGAITLHPDFAQTLRAAKSCAPFTEDGLTVGNICAKILTAYLTRHSGRAMLNLTGR